MAESQAEGDAEPPKPRHAPSSAGAAAWAAELPDQKHPWYNEFPEKDKGDPGPPNVGKDDVVETNDKDGKAKRIRMA